MRHANDKSARLKRGAFLAAYAVNCNISAACRAAGIGRSAFYDWIKDPAFKATMTRVAPNAERFHIAGELVLAEMPKQIQLSDAAAVTTVQVSPNAPAGAPSTARSGNAVAPAAVAGTSATPPSPAVGAAAPASQPPAGGVTAAGAALAGEGRKAASTVSPAPSNTTPMLVSPASPPEKKP